MTSFLKYEVHVDIRGGSS